MTKSRYGRLMRGLNVALFVAVTLVCVHLVMSWVERGNAFAIECQEDMDYCR